MDLSCEAGSLSLCCNTSNKPLDLSQPEQLTKEQMVVDVPADKTHVPKDWWSVEAPLFVKVVNRKIY